MMVVALLTSICCVGRDLFHTFFTPLIFNKCIPVVPQLWPRVEVWSFALLDVVGVQHLLECLELSSHLLKRPCFDILLAISFGECEMSLHVFPQHILFCLWKGVRIIASALPFSDADRHVVPDDCPDLTHVLLCYFLGSNQPALFCNFGDDKPPFHHLCTTSGLLPLCRSGGLTVQDSLIS